MISSFGRIPVAIVAIALMYTQALATPPTAIAPLDCNWKLKSYDPSTGVAQVVAVITVPEEQRWRLCDNYRAELADSKSLEVLGPVDWELSFEPGIPLERTLRIRMVPGETGYVHLSFECTENQLVMNAMGWFEAGDTLGIYLGDPRSIWRPQRRKPDWDTLSAEVLAREYDIVAHLGSGKLFEMVSRELGYEPEVDLKGYAKLRMSLGEFIRVEKAVSFDAWLYDPPEWSDLWPVPSDFKFVWTEPEKPAISRAKTAHADGTPVETDLEQLEPMPWPAESDQQRMERLEQKPLTADPLQTIKVNGESYRRYRGETKFSKVEAVAPEVRRQMVATVMDSINALPSTAELDIGMYLGSEDRQRAAGGIVDSLVPGTEPNYFFTRSTKERIKRLREIGVDVTLLDTIPHSRAYWPGYGDSNYKPPQKLKSLDQLRRESEDDTSGVQGSIRDEKASSGLTVWTEPFDASWTSRWSTIIDPWAMCGRTGYPNAFWAPELIVDTEPAARYICGRGWDVALLTANVAIA